MKRTRRSNLAVLISLSVVLGLVLIPPVATPGAEAAPKIPLVKNIMIADNANVAAVMFRTLEPAAE